MPTPSTRPVAWCATLVLGAGLSLQAQAAPVGFDAQGVQLLQQGATHRLKTGQDVNGAAADVEFNFGTLGYLQNELWFDPDPLRMGGAVPFNRTDAYSVMLHEWGHAFGFNGWLNGFTGARPAGYRSTFGQWVEADVVNGLSTLFFKGPQAMTVYGGRVPLTAGNHMHLGNFGPRPGAALCGWLGTRRLRHLSRAAASRRSHPAPRRAPTAA